MKQRIMDSAAPLVTHQEAGDEDVLLTSKQIRARVGGVSDMCIWRWMRDERVMFPRPMQMKSAQLLAPG